LLEQLVKDVPDWLEPHVELANLYYKITNFAGGKTARGNDRLWSGSPPNSSPEDRENKPAGSERARLF
jgi:hypothetical protein